MRQQARSEDQEESGARVSGGDDAYSHYRYRAQPTAWVTLSVQPPKVVQSESRSGTVPVTLAVVVGGGVAVAVATGTVAVTVKEGTAVAVGEGATLAVADGMVTVPMASRC